MDLFYLCEEMGETVEQIFNAAIAGEVLGFLTTPGTQVLITEEGRAFIKEIDTEKRNVMMRNAILRMGLISSIYELVQKAGADGLDEQLVLDQIIIVLPFEDHVQQFKTLLVWCRYANLLTYDSDEQKLFLPD